MDANYVLLWIVGISSVTWAVRFFQLYRLRRPSWLVASGVVLATLAASLLIAPDVAGYVSGGVWALAMFLPLVLNRQVLKLMAARRYVAAARMSQVVAWLHPSRDWRLRHQNLKAMELMRRGEVEPARRLLESLQKSGTVMARHATLQLFRLDRRWEELIDWIERQLLTFPALFRDPSAFGLYVRALGEIGEVERMVKVVDELPATLKATHGALSRQMVALFALSLGGRPEPVRRLLEGPLASFDEPIRRFWVGTALQRAGHVGPARGELERALQADDRLLVETVRARLKRPLDPAQLEGTDVGAALDRLAETTIEEIELGSLTAPSRQRRAWVTAGVVAALLGVYLLEIPGGTTNPANLIDLGALIGPPTYVEGEYWRVVTAGLLHFGAIHLTLNLIGVWYFGRFLERIIGHLRFFVIYAIAGVGAMSLILAWSGFVGGEPFLLVGASASLMGIVGASAAVLFKRWRRRPTATVRRQLIALGLIVALQTVFDLTTPQVSFAAHFGGAVIGFVLGALIGTEQPLKRAAPAASSTRS